MIGVLLTSRASATISERVCPPESRVMRISPPSASPVNSFASAIVSSTVSAESSPRAAQCIPRNCRTCRSARHLLVCAIIAIGLFAGSRQINSGGSPPFTSTVRPVTVSCWAKTSMSLIRADFPDPVGPTIETESPARMVNSSNGSRRPSFAVPGRIVIVSIL